MLVAMWAFLSRNVCVYMYISKSVLYVHGLQGVPMASYSQPFELYDVDVVDVVFTLLCYTSTNVIDFLFLCAIQNRGPPAPKPRATHPNSAGPQLQSRVPPIQTPRAPSSHIKSIISTSLHGRTRFLTRVDIVSNTDT